MKTHKYEYFFEILLFLRNKIGPKKMEKKIGRSQEIFFILEKKSQLQRTSFMRATDRRECL